ncbi:MAG: EamA family transporter, partial [Deltaproteobacteria bacterium]|nr:EamA family transporter [Deltaproteobacteria bacterium]
GRLSAGVVTIVAMSEIVFSAILAYIFLDEKLTFIETIGALVIVAGILFLFTPGRVFNMSKSHQK